MRFRGVAAGALLLALCLLPAGMGAAAGQRSQARAALDAGLAHTAQEQAEVLSDYFQRSRSLTLLAARNSAFREFYEKPGSRVLTMRSDARLMDEINDGLAYLETLYPGSIGEACFIDRSGAEVARTVRGVRAILSGLSADERRNPFFTPTLALPVGSVYQARPYVSPDTQEWVISNSTPLGTPDGTKPAILHFEVTLESFRAAAASRNGPYAIDVVDAGNGHVVFDSRHPQRVGAPLGLPGDRRFAALANSVERAGRLTVDGRPGAFEHLERTPGNANDWVVVATAPTPVGPLYGIGPLSIGLIVAGVLLVALAGLVDLLARRELLSAAMTDPLTGLGNRRLLMRDLRQQLRAVSPARPLVLMLFDLNGFKTYNDLYGHTAGDDLLARLGRALDAAMTSRGRAYRLGGDEFCVLAALGQDGIGPAVAVAAAALSEHGSGFAIDASYGLILLPSETQDASEALRLVDQRMYAQKRGSRHSADRQSKDVLLHALYERSPELRARLRQVAELVGRVGEVMGMSAEETQHAVQAAELRDIGQVAVPDVIMTKQGELDDEERAFLRNLPIVSERIIAAAPALSQVARLVRSTSECFDGTGHPDGLLGDAIPLGSRIVAACYRFVVLTSDRERDPRAVGASLDDLRRQSGKQLDPQIVSVLAAVVSAAEMQATSA
ncbi:MAG TPA: HD domain-containing phosphohydrolase [Kineosporiaceae bacterium]|nr:HD domain-containing phosphohydrolase [Kineosporiaceae bacterium]